MYWSIIGPPARAVPFDQAETMCMKQLPVQKILGNPLLDPGSPSQCRGNHY